MRWLFVEGGVVFLDPLNVLYQAIDLLFELIDPRAMLHQLVVEIGYQLFLKGGFYLQVVDALSCVLCHVPL